MFTRRSFLQSTAAVGAFAAVGDFNFLTGLPRVSAADAALDTRLVRFHPDIEPLIQVLEQTPRETVLEEIAARIRRGLTYRELLAALLLAGVRNIQPRPVGFKFHAVLVINSAHLASLASPDSDRWLPIFWAIDQFKSSQAANVREGNWHLGPVDESAVPSADKARAAFIDAMDHWDESAADVAVTGLARSAGADELFEIFTKYGARDFRDIGHKAIYVANSFRCLSVIGWQHAEPVLRSLAYALLDRSGEDQNPALADLAPDRPFRHNLESLAKIRAGWTSGKPTAEATTALLATLRSGSSKDATDDVIQLLNNGVAPQSIFDALFNGAGELLMQAPGIVSLHAMTFSNAIHYAWQRIHDDETRRLLLLQNAAFLPLFRGNHQDNGTHLDTLESITPDGKDDEAIAEIFTGISKDRLTAARKTLGYLKDHPTGGSFAETARRLIFLKGRDSHDYKFSSAVFEDYEVLSPAWRGRLLASSVFHLRGSGEPDSDVAKRTRAALAG